MNDISENPILTSEQKELLLSFVKSPLSSVFYLTGGTALSAFYLRHRRSDDLDFFTDRDIDVENILSFLKAIPSIKEITYERKYDRKIFLLEDSQARFLKVEFTKYPFERLAPFLELEALLIDSMQDISANKLMTMTDRRDPKDYVDIYAIMQAFPDMKIEELISQSEKKFGIKGIKGILSGRFLEPPLCEGIPLITKIKPQDIQNYFRELARAFIRQSIE